MKMPMMWNAKRPATLIATRSFFSGAKGAFISSPSWMDGPYYSPRKTYHSDGMTSFGPGPPLSPLRGAEPFSPSSSTVASPLASPQYASRKARQRLSQHQLVQTSQSSSSAQHLDGLDMSALRISVLAPLNFRPYVSITQLNLAHNNLTSLPAQLLLELPNLSMLDLSFNRLEQLPNEFETMLQMEKLYLHNNRLRDIPLGIGRLFRLKALTLQDNPALTTPPTETIAAGTLAMLTYFRDRMPTGEPPPERRFINVINDLGGQGK
jgi:hypothetical protein